MKSYQILKSGGTLCFYGDWFGRPLDNFHQIMDATYDGQTLQINFSHDEYLIIDEPQTIENTVQIFRIEQAKQIQWMWYPSGDKTQNQKFRDYTRDEKGDIIKEVDGQRVPFQANNAEALIIY